MMLFQTLVHFLLCPLCDDEVIQENSLIDLKSSALQQKSKGCVWTSVYKVFKY